LEIFSIESKRIVARSKWNHMIDFGSEGDHVSIETMSTELVLRLLHEP